MDGRDEIVKAVAREIERYFQAHPNAADTAEGILRWWLPHGGADVSSEDLQLALKLLLASGHIVERRTPDQRRLYARASKSSANDP